MRHAYLILAHNEPEVVRTLVSLIDDERNDIFIHWDAKQIDVPRLTTRWSRLFMVKPRIDVRWGDYSVVEAEMVLMRGALHAGSYGYLHLLSGVDMPLKSQDYIHEFFDRNKGREFIGFHQGDDSAEIERKIRRWHLFPRHFRSRSLPVRMLRAAFLRAQETVAWRRNGAVDFKKGTQWVSITPAFATYVLQHSDMMRHQCRHTFCPDEIVLQTLCWHSPFRTAVYDLSDEGKGCLRAVKWRNNVIERWTPSEVEQLLDSDMLFARKFSSQETDVLKMITRRLCGDHI